MQPDLNTKYARKVRVADRRYLIAVLCISLAYPVVLAGVPTITIWALEKYFPQIEVQLPILAIAFAIGATAAYSVCSALYRRIRWGWRWVDGTWCLNCKYDLTGNVSGRCPECGMEIDSWLEACGDNSDQTSGDQPGT